MKLFFFFLLFSLISFSQKEQKHFFSVGESVSLTRYRYDYTSPSSNPNGGDLFEKRTSYYLSYLNLNGAFQTKYTFSSLEFSITASPYESVHIYPSIKQAFNSLFFIKNKYLFLGPYINVGRIIHIDSKVEYKNYQRLGLKTGLFFASKYFLFEAGFLFREDRAYFLSYIDYKNAFYVSAGFRIPLEKKQKA